MDEQVTVLLVEDDETAIKVTSYGLQDEAPGWRLVVARRLEEALRIASGDLPSAVLLDLNLPDSRGLDTYLRWREAMGHVPVIILTSSTEYEPIGDLAFSQGAQCWLDKGEATGPRLVHEISQAIKRVTYLRQQLELLQRHCENKEMLGSMHDSARELKREIEKAKNGGAEKKS